MPWEARRWVIFAVLMAVMSLYALTYRPNRDREPSAPHPTSTEPEGAPPASGRQ